MRSRIHLWLRSVITSLLIVPFLAVPSHAATDIDQVVGDFEYGTQGWALGLGPEFPGAKGALTSDAADARTGARSALLTADLTAGGKYVEAGYATAADLNALSLWARSPALPTVTLRLVDSTGQTHQQRLPLAAGGGWQRLTVTSFTAGQSYQHFGGAGDGVWHGPAKRVAFLVERTGQLRLDGVTITAPAPDLALGQRAVGNVFVQPTQPSFDVTSRGDALTWTVRDLSGVQVAAGGGTPGTLAVPVARPGHYRLSVTATAAGTAIATKETAFAVLTPFTATGDSPFGVAGHFTRADWGAPGGDLLELGAKAGVRTVRDDAFWESIEKTEGVYEYGRYDPLHATLDAEGMRWLPIAAYTNPHHDGNATPYTDAGRAAYAAYASALIGRYDLPWIEVYNEFNIGFGDRGNGPADSRADYYFPLLKATYEKVKADHPQVTVVGPASAGVPLAWLEELFKLGALKYLDAVSIHPYVYPGTPESAAKSIDDLDALVRKYNNGRSKPIWITEQGWPTHTDARGVTEAVQAAYVVRAHVTALAKGVQRFFWYDFMNDGTDPALNEDNFGLVRNTADASGRWTPKPGYVAYAAMTRQLTGAAHVRQEAEGRQLFRKDGHDLRVLWSAKPATVSLRTDAPLTVTDLAGASEVLRPLAGRVTLSLSSDPIYVRGDAVLEDAARYTVTGGGAVVGEGIELKLAVDATRGPAVRGSFAVGDVEVPVSVRGGRRAEIPVSLPAVTRTGPLDLVGRLKIHGRPVARLGSRVEVTQPFAISARHVLPDDLAITVRNLSARELAPGDLGWTFGARTGTLPIAGTVPAGGSRTERLPLADLPAGPYELRLDAVAGVGVTGRVARVADGALNRAGRATITVDGVPDDLTGRPAVDLADGTVKIPSYGGPDDLSGTLHVTWDADRFYLSARIHDDVHTQTSTGADIWQGDCLQFAVAAGLPGETRTWSELGLALTAHGPQFHRWLGDGPEPEAKVAVTRDETAEETVYELSLPWAALAPLTPQDGLFSLSVVANDNDGTGREGWIEWGSGIAGTKNPALFRPARFIGQ
ncbi:sugar-binding protein [Nonomuraea sp. NPDC049646]|uniref:sugar-binding protein n=1 Tax=unclassified Nonomuraea TaxID=2593643 RepID=UPI00378E5F75